MLPKINFSFNIKVIISKYNLTIMEMTETTIQLLRERKSWQEIHTGEVQRQMLRGEMCVCAAFQTYVLFYSFEKWSGLSGQNGIPGQDIGWSLPWPPTVAAPLPFIQQSAPLLRTYVMASSQASGLLQYFPPFVSQQLLIKWVSISS